MATGLSKSQGRGHDDVTSQEEEEGGVGGGGEGGEREQQARTKTLQQNVVESRHVSWLESLSPAAL